MFDESNHIHKDVFIGQQCKVKLESLTFPFSGESSITNSEVTFYICYRECLFLRIELYLHLLYLDEKEIFRNFSFYKTKIKNFFNSINPCLEKVFQTLTCSQTHEILVYHPYHLPSYSVPECLFSEWMKNWNYFYAFEKDGPNGDFYRHSQPPSPSRDSTVVKPSGSPS